MPGNNCVRLGNYIGLVRNILRGKEQMHFVFQKFGVMVDFFEYPLKSSELGIFCVSGLEDALLVATVDAFMCKCLLLPCNQHFLFFLCFIL